MERAVQLATLTVGGRGAVVIVLDSDDDCPAQLGPELLQRAARVRRDIPIAVILPKRKFEAWFLAAAESLRGYRGMLTDLDAPPDPESVRGAKEWLSSRMVPGGKYVPTLDQAAFAERFDLQAARRADSFDKCYRETTRLLKELREAERRTG